MKVAVFTGSDDVVVLAVKGRNKDVSAVDGFDEFFGDYDSGLRNIEDYNVKLCHVGAGEGLIIETRVRSECTGKETDIDEWFDTDED